MERKASYEPETVAPLLRQPKEVILDQAKVVILDPAFLRLGSYTFNILDIEDTIVSDTHKKLRSGWWLHRECILQTGLDWAELGWLNWAG
jgi:hypothetical protein